MDEEFEAAFHQQTSGRTGYNDLINHWLMFATLRESANMVRLHRRNRIGMLERALERFFEHDKVKKKSNIKQVLLKRSQFRILGYIFQEVWHVMGVDTPTDQALLYVPWQDMALQRIYQIARKYLFVNCTLYARIMNDNTIQLLIVVANDFNWRVTAEFEI